MEAFQFSLTKEFNKIIEITMLTSNLYNIFVIAGVIFAALVSWGLQQGIRRYWPGLPEGSLQPAYAGLRPKIAGPGAPACQPARRGPMHP